MFGLQIFELLETLDIGHRAEARLLVWTGQHYVSGQDTILVHDHAGSHGVRGDRGYCFLSPVSNQWEVVGGLQCDEWSVA
jgi:hypothetical protein